MNGAWATRAARWCVCAVLAACAAPPAASLDWTVGVWNGVRRAVADGREDSMRVVVEALPDGSGQFERIEVAGEPRPYVGFALRVQDNRGRWAMLYGNMLRERIARLEGEVHDGVFTARSVAPAGGRTSRLVSQRLDADRWRRTQWVSADDGTTWSVLFTDELQRESTPRTAAR